MTARIDKPATGVVFAAVGMAACIAVWLVQHWLLVYGPAIRAFLLEAITWQFALGMFTMSAIVALMVWALASVEQ